MKYHQYFQHCAGQVGHGVPQSTRARSGASHKDGTVNICEKKKRYAQHSKVHKDFFEAAPQYANHDSRRLLGELVVHY